jgi:2-polyprenyl-3-methyl-5-hydroxy-6-metoxy-1,4-benzoquinol methylase
MDDVVAFPEKTAAAVPGAALSRQTSPRRQSPPKAIHCVLPVWGYRFVRQFLEVGLPTLLAPGNVPALAAALPTRFIILSRLEDEDFIRHHSAFRRLCEVCETEIRLIDHLITGSNYSTTITLGYTEAIRAAGNDMLDTCFYFLVSDYIMADGSLASALERMMDGRSGVLVGNFQVVLEDALPWLQEQLNRSPSVLAIPPRELLHWAFNHLHPATLANTVNVPLSHNKHTNRLFWRVDGNTLLARFYLMHMLCIRPETTEFTIGASCDYSFIPELCPSDNVEVITDSDDYLVIEMQPIQHEARFLQPGPLRPKALARTLSSWTTDRHRKNSQYSVIFHANEIPPVCASVRAEADQFVTQVSALMKRQPKPHRDHPYWRGAIAAHHEATGRKLALDEWRRVLGLPDPEGDQGWASDWVVEQIRFALFGRPPKVRLWHHRWPDYRFIVKWLGRFLDDPHRRLLLASEQPTVFTASLADSGERTVRIIPSLFTEGPLEIWEPMADAFDFCLAELSEGELARAGDLVDRIAPMMKDGGEILIVTYNRRDRGADEFGPSIDLHAPRVLRPSTALIGAHFVRATRLRWWLARVMTDLGRMAHSKPIVGIPLIMLGGGFLALGGLLANGATFGQTTSRLPRGKIATSFALVLQVDITTARTAYQYSARRLERQQRRRRQGLPTIPERASAWRWEPGNPPRMGQPPNAPTGSNPAQPADPSEKIQASRVVTASATDREASKSSDSGVAMREPQYADCVDVKNQHGLTPLGLMINQVWHDDPRRVAFVLARYKFVAKMLSGRGSVAEVGCGDAFGTRIVLQEVDHVDVYDFDPVFIEDIRQRQSERWQMTARVHDIVLGVLPYQYDGIYSLDVIEHINREDEHGYLANLRGSLNDGGILIIGTPSLESQQYASSQSKIGHVNCKSGDELKALMQRYFENVFLFSMNDEVVHTGFYSMAHYLIAVCCGKIMNDAIGVTPRP